MSSVIEQADIEIDNLRAAFGWSRENSDIELALALASSLQPLWQARGRLREGLAWFDAALADLDAQHPEVAAAVRARALADQRRPRPVGGRRRQPGSGAASPGDRPRGRGPGPAGSRADRLRPTSPATTTPRRPAGTSPRRSAWPGNWTTGGGSARSSTCQAVVAVTAGDPIAARATGQEGGDLADAIGDRFNVAPVPLVPRNGTVDAAAIWPAAAAQFREVAAEAEAAHDEIWRANSLVGQSAVLAWQGDTGAARAAADAAIEAAAELGGITAGIAYTALATAALATGDAATALEATEAAWQHMSVLPARAAVRRVISARAALASGDLTAARRWADEAVATASGPGHDACRHPPPAPGVAAAQDEPEQAERDAHEALAIAVAVSGVPVRPRHPGVPRHPGRGRWQSPRSRAALRRGIRHRQRTGAVRFKVWDAAHEASVAAVRNAMGDERL